MKPVILVIAIVAIMFSCKKKEDPKPEPIDECLTSPAQFVGKYWSADGDTVRITFLRTNCPADNQNIYQVVGLGEVANKHLKPNESFDVKNYDVIATEAISKAIYNNEFSLGRQSSGDLIFSCPKITFGSMQIYKVP
jgi:hypothetical protein